MQKLRSVGAREVDSIIWSGDQTKLIKVSIKLYNKIKWYYNSLCRGNEQC